MEAWSIVWVWSTLLTLRQHGRRLRNIAAAIEDFEQLRQRLASSKTRLRGAPEIDMQIKLTLDKHHVGRCLKVRRIVREEHVFKQALDHERCGRFSIRRKRSTIWSGRT